MASVKVSDEAMELVTSIAKAHKIEPSEAVEKLIKHGYSRVNALTNYANKKAGDPKPAKKASKKSTKKADAGAKKSAKKAGKKVAKKGAKKAPKKTEETEEITISE